MKRRSLAVLLLLVGCAVDQADDVATWRRELELGEPIAFAPSQPLTLAQAVRLANEHDERLAIQGEDWLQALIEKSRINAGFFPAIDFAPTYTFRERSHSGVPFLDDPSLLDVPLRAQVNLFEGFRGTAREAIATLSIDERRAVLLDLRETIVLEVAQAYYRVLRAEQRVTVLDNSLGVQRQRTRETEARQRIGTARSLDVLQTGAQASRTMLELIDAKNDAAVGRRALGRLTGVDVTASRLGDAFEVPAARPSVDELLAFAVAQRQDLQAAALAAEVARRRVDLAIGQYYPSIGVDLEYFLSRDSLPLDRDWTGLLSLGMPLFAAGRIDAEVHAAWSVFRQSVLRYWQLRRTIRHDLAVTSDQLATLEARIAELGHQVAADTATMRQAEVAFRNGLATNLDRTAAQDQLLRTQLQLAEAELDRKLGWLTMLRQAGGLTPRAIDVPVPELPTPPPVPDSPFVHHAG